MATTTSASIISPLASFTPFTTCVALLPAIALGLPPKGSVTICSTAAPVRISTPSSSHNACSEPRTLSKPPLGYHTPSVSSVAARSEKTPGALYGERPTYSSWYEKSARSFGDLKYFFIC